MAAGERCSAVGVIRLVIAEMFPANEVLAEIHHGIEDNEGEVEYTRLDEHSLTWAQAKALVPPEDWAAVLRFVGAVEADCKKKHPEFKKRALRKFDEKRKKSKVVPFAPL